MKKEKSIPLLHISSLSTASYLPRPSAVEYQFVYVDQRGEVCARSRQFTFCISRPLDELETLTEERDEDEEGGEGDGDDLLLVVPRAQLLQVGMCGCTIAQFHLTSL